MKDKRPWILIALIIFAFGLIYILNSQMTGYSVYGKLSSIFSGNALSTMGPVAILVTIFAVAIAGFKKIKEK